MGKAKPVEDVVDADDILAEVTARTMSTWLCTKGHLTEEIQQLERQLIAAQQHDTMSNEPDRAPEVAARIRELEEEAKRHEREFVFTGLSQKGWSDLKGQHPPTAEQRKQAPGLDRNHETFWPAAIAACLTRPAGFTAEKVAKLADALSSGDWERLVATCRAVNEGASITPFSPMASRVLRTSNESSDSPAS